MNKFEQIIKRKMAEKERQKIAFDKGVEVGTADKIKDLAASDQKTIDIIKARRGDVVSKDGRVSYFRSPFDLRKIEAIKFEINDLLEPSNLMKEHKMVRLKDLLNKYVLGDTTLELNGNLDSIAQNAINMFKQQSREWDGNSFQNINPLRIFEKYSLKQKARMETTHTSVT